MNRNRHVFPGRFITFEGPEGAGKTTQIRLLSEYLENGGRVCCHTREPGGTPFAEELRKLIKQWQAPTDPLTPLAELLLIEAARAQHVANRIRPALERGDIVLCDRFADSTRAYQGAGRRLDAALIDTIGTAVMTDCRPDLTILLDLPVEKGFARTRGRTETAGSFDRFEAEELAFHRRVRKAFLTIAEREPGRVRVIDADAAPEIVWERIREAVDDAL